jgi:hypothetical protein
LSPTQNEVLSALRAHPDASALCTRVSQIVLAAAEQRNVSVLSSNETLELSAGAVALSREQADTPWGNLLQILDEGAQQPVHWQLLSSALALYVGTTWSELPRASTLNSLAWLAEHTPCNAWFTLDSCLGENAESFWTAAVEQVANGSTGAQLAIAAACSVATSPPAQAFKRDWLSRASNPTLVHLLTLGAPLDGLSGEAVTAPRRAWLWVIQGLSGWLFVAGLARLFSRYVLGLRKRASLQLDGGGLRVVHSRSLLGQPLREQTHWIPLEEIHSVTRETRYQGLGLYLGLAALAVGSYVGVGLLVTGLRVPGGSPSAIGTGLAIIALGVGLDLLSTWLGRYSPGRTRVLIATRRGKNVALGAVEIGEADAWLDKLGLLRTFRA